ncbi:cellulose-binding GDSL lipase/acylhydrolase-like protein, putative [Rhizoctonia solani AG-3 Rhs1AP]|uniref:Cellulose-binding GDSL lipase/acylhydrolase-like protein, putative n=2 Tax=Rhizoctonia solani AG-3 TaxID=1086053 RepID=X8JH93_9AGAM|nr:cellulose-binding GDSL lipase/acylhydrolase-like protein, putative [Rhizoctonia solani AG-3 Rhs1AP]KEP53490.1 putative cellulose-binding GDSL lipase/acylhydrolase-like protein [Rhizoctonia solani 123E]
MSRVTLFSIAALTALVSGVNAQQPVYAQCGGANWTGATTCATGSTCVRQSEWYSQCLPGVATTTTKPVTSSTAAPVTSKTTSSSTPTSSTTPAGVKYWFSFGDSYTQTGFDINGTKPTVGNPLGNPTYPGYTACGSVPNWVDLVTTQYNTSSLLTYNFAYGGATINATLVAPYLPTVLSLIDQVNIFLANKAVAPWSGSNSLFSVFIGINDIGNSWYNSGDRAAFSDTLLDSYFALIKKIYDVGGRNFLFVNVPHVDRSPLMLAQSADSRAAEAVVINGFNTKLAARASAFASANSGVKTWLYDSATKLNTLLDSPATYGFQDATSYGSASNLMWCNDYHVSSGVHDYFAKDVSTLLKGSFTRR